MSGTRSGSWLRNEGGSYPPAWPAIACTTALFVSQATSTRAARARKMYVARMRISLRDSLVPRALDVVRDCEDHLVSDLHESCLARSSSRPSAFSIHAKVREPNAGPYLTPTRP